MDTSKKRSDSPGSASICKGRSSGALRPARPSVPLRADRCRLWERGLGIDSPSVKEGTCLGTKLFGEQMCENTPGVWQHVVPSLHPSSWVSQSSLLAWLCSVGGRVPLRLASSVYSPCHPGRLEQPMLWGLWPFWSSSETLRVAWQEGASLG